MRLFGVLESVSIRGSNGKIKACFNLNKKNTIVNGGLDYIFMHNGSTTGGFNPYYYWIPDTMPFFVGDVQNHVGFLHFCAYGSNGDNTNVTDTDLHNRLVTPYSTKYTEVDFNKTTVDKSNLHFSSKVSHESPASSQSITIREIGYFGKIGNSYVLFSRIVLPRAIELAIGETLITSYIITLAISNASSVESTLGDIQWKNEQKMVFENAFSFLGAVNSVGSPQLFLYKSYGRTMFPIFYIGDYSDDWGGDDMFYSTSPNVAFEDAFESNSNPYNFTKLSTSKILHDYTLGSFFRDKDYEATLPSGTTAIRINGKVVRFGEYVNGVWTPQIHSGKIRIRMRFSVSS